MDRRKKGRRGYTEKEGIFAVLPEALIAAILNRADADTVEEIRIRIERPILIRCRGKECTLGVSAKQALLKDILARATGYSVYSYEDTLKCGWIPLPKGGRMGVAAHLTANGIREVSSLCLRRPFPHDAIDEKEFLSIYPAGFINTLILSPPGWGKTTLLRSLIHMLSLSGRTVGVADERMEIAGMSGGIASFELGDRVDVISGGRKGDAIMMLMRSMAPEIIAFDEITAKEDIAFAEEAAFCGVGLLSTAHAASKDDLMKRRLYRELLESGVYEMAIEIHMENGGRRYRVEKL